MTAGSCCVVCGLQRSADIAGAPPGLDEACLVCCMSLLYVIELLCSMNVAHAFPE